MQRISYDTEKDFLCSMREEDEYEFSQVEAEEGHPIYSLWLFVKSTSYEVEDGMVSFRGACIPQDEVYGCIMLYVQYLTDQPWSQEPDITFYEYGNRVGFSHDNAMEWEKYIPYKSEIKEDIVESGQGKLLLAQLESFPTEFVDTHTVVVFGSNSGMIETGLSYPAIARIMTPNVEQGHMHLYDISEVTQVQQEGAYTLHKHSLDLTYDKMNSIISDTEPDDIIYDMYDDNKEYVSLQESLVMAYPYRRHLLKVPTIDIAKRLKNRFARQGVYSRIIDQIYYNGREVRMQVSRSVVPETIQVYSMLTSMYPSQHNCYACKRIHLLAYRHNVEVKSIYDELLQLGIRPCTQYSGQRMIRKISMIKRFIGNKSSYSYDSLSRYLMQHDMFITSIEADLVIQHLKKSQRRLEFKKGDIYRQDIPFDYKEMFRCFPMGKVCVRMIGGSQDHWAFQNLYADGNVVLSHKDFSSGKRLVYSGSSELDFTRCIAFPEGVSKYTLSALNILIDTYKINNMYMTRHVVIRDTSVIDINNFFKLFTIDGRGYFTTVYKRKNDYTDDRGGMYAIYQDKLYYNGLEIDMLHSQYGFHVGTDIVTIDRQERWIDITIPFNKTSVVRLYKTGFWEYFYDVDSDEYSRLKYSLRHMGKYIDDEGWAYIPDVEQGEKLDVFDISYNYKDRFDVDFQVSGDRIRSIIGHTVDIKIPRIKVDPLRDIPYNVLVHGTYERLVTSIKNNGLLMGTRLAIFFTVNPRYIPGVCGLKKDVEVVIYLDYDRYLKDGNSLYLTSNGVIVAVDSIKPDYIIKYIHYKTGLPI